MKEIVTQEILKLQEEADKHWEKYIELKELIKEKKKEHMHLDFEGKFIKYDDGWGRTIYMKVDWVTTDKLRYADKDFSYMFRGLGFDGEFTGYGDATDFNWSYWYEFYIYGTEEELLTAIDRIEVITQKEFNEVLEEQLNKLKEYHYTNKTNGED